MEGGEGNEEGDESDEDGEAQGYEGDEGYEGDAGYEGDEGHENDQGYEGEQGYEGDQGYEVGEAEKQVSDLLAAMRWYLLRGGGRRGVSYGGVARAVHLLNYLDLIYTLCMFYVTMNICMFDVLYLCMFYVQTPLILQGVSACWLEGRLDGGAWILL